MRASDKQLSAVTVSSIYTRLTFHPASKNKCSTMIIKLNVFVLNAYHPALFLDVALLVWCYWSSVTSRLHSGVNCKVTSLPDRLSSKYFSRYVNGISGTPSNSPYRWRNEQITAKFGSPPQAAVASFAMLEKLIIRNWTIVFSTAQPYEVEPLQTLTVLHLSHLVSLILKKVLSETQQSH